MMSFPRPLFAFWLWSAALLVGAQMAYAECSDQTDKGQTFMGRNVNSGYGHNDSGAHAGENHAGIDLRTRDNPNVGAFFSGTVTNSGWVRGYGNTVTVTNPSGTLRAFYAHAGNITATGGTVSQGQSLGDWTTGSPPGMAPHLHLNYEVNVNGQWYEVDPVTTQNLIDNGLSPTDPSFGQQALDATKNRCNSTDQELARSQGGNKTIGPICDTTIYANVAAQLQSAVARQNEFASTNLTPPPSVAQVANTPCQSQELQRISNQFSYMPTLYTNQILGSMTLGGGPISGLVARFFRAEIGSITSAASFLPKMFDMQSMASQALTSLMTNLGLGAFSSSLCGLMVDMLIKYVQCAVPFQMPSLSGWTNPLNMLDSLIPEGCAGDALKSGLYAVSNNQSLMTINQPITTNSGGTFVPGSAQTINNGRGLPPIRP